MSRSSIPVSCPSRPSGFGLEEDSHDFDIIHIEKATQDAPQLPIYHHAGTTPTPQPQPWPPSSAVSPALRQSHSSRQLERTNRGWKGATQHVNSHSLTSCQERGHETPFRSNILVAVRTLP